MKLPDGYVAGIAPKPPTAMGGFGQQMLEKMGWQKGDGLGKARQGRSSHIEVSLKDDKCGLGGKYMWDWEKDYAATAFDAAVAKIGGHADSSSSDSDSSDSDDDEHTQNLDGTASSAKQAEMKLSRQLAKGNNLGRFGGRAGKLARVREQEAKEAALMGITVAPLADSNSSRAPKRARTDSSEPAKPVKRIVFEVKSRTLVDNSQPVQPPSKQPESWWGHQAFTSAGWLGGMGDDESTRKRQEFSENTQEDIYMRLHEQQTKGRRGMGKRAIKLGVDWEGSKTTFADGDAAAAAADPASGDEAEDPPRKKKKKKSKAGDSNSSPLAAAELVLPEAVKSRKKTKLAGKVEPEAASAGSTPGDCMQAVRTCLAAAKNGKLKCGKLYTQVAERLGVSLEKATKQVTKRVASGKLVEEGGRIKLS